MFLSSLSQTVVATTMPLIVADLGGFDRYTWAATSYVVAATIAFPIVGRLSDIYGRRLFLLLGLAIFCIGSILLGFSESMNQVVTYRAIQGIGGGAIMTSCYVSVADLFKPEERGRFHGILTAVYGVSFLVGPALGGFLADTLSWGWAFLLIGLAGIPVLLLTAFAFPKHHGHAVDRDFDILGMLALALAVPPFFVALSSGGVQYEWQSPFILAMLLFAMMMIGIFIFIESRAKSPIMPLSLYADPVISVFRIHHVDSRASGCMEAFCFFPCTFRSHSIYLRRKAEACSLRCCWEWLSVESRADNSFPDPTQTIDAMRRFFPGS